MGTPRRARFIQPEDFVYCDKATGQFAREYPAKFLAGAAANNKAPFVMLRDVVSHAKEEVLDQWSYLTLIEDRIQQAKTKLVDLELAIGPEHAPDVKAIYDLLP